MSTAQCCVGLFRCLQRSFFFFFNDTATTEIYTLSLHDALPISKSVVVGTLRTSVRAGKTLALSLRLTSKGTSLVRRRDRKSTRLNSSHSQISYAVFCLKKKNRICLDRYD